MRRLKGRPGSHSERSSVMLRLAAATGRPVGGGRTRAGIPPSSNLLSSGTPSACCGPLICLLFAAYACPRNTLDAPVRCSSPGGCGLYDLSL
eukprot:6664590-Pyramimonas_sp.AAC.1